MIFENNINALRRKDPELADILSAPAEGSSYEIVTAKNSTPSMKINNIRLHSFYDPAEEAVSWVRHYAEEIDGASRIIVLGFGLGYHITELCRVTDKEIVVVEPDINILKKAFENIDVTSILPLIKIVTDGKVPSSDDRTAVAEHKPSMKLNKKFYTGIKAGLHAMKEISRGLRIMVVGPVHGGSHGIAQYCSLTLKKMGHNVEFVDNTIFKDALFYTRDIANGLQNYGKLVDHLSMFISETVISRCESFKPHLVLALAQAPLSVDCLERLRKSGIPTAFWFVEDFRVMTYWRKIAGFYDYFFTIQKGEFFRELEKEGLNNFHYLPMAACPEIHKPVELQEEERSYYGSDISFVGAGYHNRREFFKGLIDFNLKIWGSDWDLGSVLAKHIQRSGESIGTEEIVKIFNASKININLHSSTYHREINPFGDFVNPRTFEIICSGGFQLVDRRMEIGGLLKEDEEIIVFEDLDDLRSKITYYLGNPEEMEKIQGKGRQRILRDHTYENRMKEMLRFIAERGYKRPDWKESGEDVAELIEEAGRDTELGEYLGTFSDMNRITLQDIKEAVRKGEGNILRTERIFLLMKEFVR